MPIINDSLAGRLVCGQEAIAILDAEKNISEWLQLYGYQRVYSSHIYGNKTKQLSASCIKNQSIGNEEFYLRNAMFIAHACIFRDNAWSYKDLPVKYFEIGDIYHQSKNGVVHERVIESTIFCDRKDVKKNIKYIKKEFRVDGYEIFVINQSAIASTLELYYMSEAGRKETPSCIRFVLKPKQKGNAVSNQKIMIASSDDLDRLCAPKPYYLLRAVAWSHIGVFMCGFIDCVFVQFQPFVASQVLLAMGINMLFAILLGSFLAVNRLVTRWDQRDSLPSLTPGRFSHDNVIDDDPVRRMVIAEAMNSGKVVVANVDDDGKVYMKHVESGD